MTKREEAEAKYKKKVLELAKAHQKAGDVEKVKRYFIPKENEVRQHS